MNLFKIKIPKNNAQKVTEVESFTVKWQVLTRGWSCDTSTKTMYKVFVNKKDAKRFRKKFVSVSHRYYLTKYHLYTA